MHIKAVVEKMVEPIRTQLVSPTPITPIPYILGPKGNTVITSASWNNFSTEARLSLLALTTRVVAKPFKVMEPVEYCGRIVTMEVLVDPQFYVAADPLFPIPLVALSNKFWNIYANFVESVDRYITVSTSTVLLPYDKIRYSKRLIKRAWRLADRLVKMASPSLRRCETLYFSARLRAALAGERAKI